MKILIVSRYFAPDNTVGAIRWTKFSKYLTRLGHDVTVYAMEPWTKIRDPILERDAKELPRVFRIGHGRLYRAMHDFFARRDPTAGTGSAEIRQAMRADGAGAASGNAPRKVGALTEKLLSIAYHVMQLWMERDFVRTYRRYTKEDTETYDAVIGTWSTDSSLLVALDMKKRGRAKKFVADFRDSCVSSWPELTKNRDVRRMLKRVYEEADLVMAVGEKVLEANRAFAPAARKTAVLTNGYDPEDLAGIGPQPDDGRFHIVYTGQIYPGLQDFTDLFAALRSLIARGVLPKDGVRLDYLGQSYAVLREQAAACGMEGSVVNHGFVPRSTALSFERSADVLLFVTWNSDAFPAFPAKFLEYMLMDKPVLALITGNTPGFPPGEVMRETGLGFTHGNGDPESLAEMEKWIAEKIAEKCSGSGTERPSNPATAAYSYPDLAARLCGILDSVLRS